MTSRILGRFTGRRSLIAGAAVGAAFFAGADRTPARTDNAFKTATEEFHTSSMYPKPSGWTGRTFRIRNDYPKPSSTASKTSGMPTLPGPDLPVPGGGRDAPWLDIDYEKEPERYCALIKEYCLAGNVNNDFVLQKNKIRDWYHAPWMHYSNNGREPLNGLTNELSTPAGVISKDQKRQIQNWACGFYNRAGASIFGQIWENPADPQWNQDVMFPEETCVFKVLFTEATRDEISILNGAPTMEAVIAKSPKKPQDRMDSPTQLRLMQMDFAVRDNRAPIGWIFGTFIYDGTRQNEKNPWDRLIPVGFMWGNSPKLDQAAYERGETPQEQWMNPQATTLLASLGGTKAFPGWNKRMNGPVDNFISACASCHSVSQKTGETAITQPKTNIPGINNKPPNLTPKDDTITMKWFRNIPSGQSFTPGAVSGDYSLQLMIGYHNYHAWRKSIHPFWSFTGMKYVVWDRQLGAEGKRENLRGQAYEN